MLEKIITNGIFLQFHRCTQDMNRVAPEVGIIMELHVMVNFKTFCKNVFRVLLNGSLQKPEIISNIRYSRCLKSSTSYNSLSGY